MDLTHSAAKCHCDTFNHAAVHTVELLKHAQMRLFIALFNIDILKNHV